MCSPSGVCAPITQRLLGNTAVLISTADLAPLRGLGVCALVAQQLLVSTAVLICPADLGAGSIIDVLALGVCAPHYSATAGGYCCI